MYLVPVIMQGSILPSCSIMPAFKITQASAEECHMALASQITPLVTAE